MGYVETCCQLCAVSFNIARVRTKHEPPSSAWGYSSPRLYYAGDEQESRCIVFGEEMNSGCENLDHGDLYAHCAGEGCSYSGGYSGWRIGVEEMKGMIFPRYIVGKPPSLSDYENEQQEDYERASDFFVTPQTVAQVDNNQPGAFAFKRFDVSHCCHNGHVSFLPQNSDVMGDGRRFGIPVHDACWKIFEKVCEQRMGKVDLQGFVALWWRDACGNCGFRGLKHDPAVAKCRDSMWSHKPGTEYLAANPHDIPGFSLVMQQAYIDEAKGGGAFLTRHNSTASYDLDGFQDIVYCEYGDPFSRLPQELRNMLLLLLPSSDIANLRLVSRSFRQLPKSLFKHLILNEMAWFWEIDDIEEQHFRYWKRWVVKQYSDDLSRLPSISPGYTGVYPPAYKKQIRFARDIMGGVKREINWLRVYEELKILQMGILGVRNRVRIWKVVEEVVKRIEILRDSQSSERYIPRHEGGVGVEPTIEEKKQGDVHNGHRCPTCPIIT